MGGGRCPPISLYLKFYFIKNPMQNFKPLGQHLLGEKFVVLAVVGGGVNLFKCSA